MAVPPLSEDSFRETPSSPEKLMQYLYFIWQEKMQTRKKYSYLCVHVSICMYKYVGDKDITHGFWLLLIQKEIVLLALHFG